MAVAWDAVIALVSGVPLILLGFGLFLLAPRRVEQTFFAAFAVVWGVQVLAANFGRVVGDAAIHAASLLFSVALMPLAAALLVHSTLASTRTRGPWLSLVAGAVALAGAVVSVVAPDWIVVSVTGSDLVTEWGVGQVPLFFVPFYLAFYLTLVVLYRAYRHTEVGSRRHHTRALLAALALFTSYNSVHLLFSYQDPAPTLAALGPAHTGTLVALFALGTAVVAGIAFHLIVRPPPPEDLDIPLVLTFVVPAAVALGETFAAQVGLLVFDSVGLWRLLAVSILVYALARRHLFDLDLRLKRLAGISVAGLCVALGVLAGIVLWVDGHDVFRAAMPVLIGLTLGGLSLAARDRLADWLFPGVSQEDDYLHQRRLEVYRSLLEATYAETGRLDSSDVREARRTLSIDDREHRIMEFMVQKSVRQTRDEAVPPEQVLVTPGALLKGRYKIDRLLGEGAHGRAHLAYDQDEDRQVVVKAVGTSFLGGRAAQLLLKEAKLLKKVDHPNVVRIHEAIEGTHETVIVMEFADGGNLYGLLSRRGRLPVDEATHLLDQVLAGLVVVHGKGIVHRDLKPENILLMRDGTPRMADFGVARETRPDATGLTAGAVGTLLYMSPEQVRGLPVDARSDLYAAAVVFHQMVTGRFYLPIAGKDDFQVRRTILEGRPNVDARTLPGGLVAFLRRALAKDPAERFPDATAMRKALAGSASYGTASAPEHRGQAAPS